MKKYVINEEGITLAELLVGMLLSVLLLSGLLHFFLAQLKNWTLEKNRTSMEQVVRIAVDAMMRDIRYGKELSLPTTHSLQIVKPSGEINKFELGEGLHDKTLYMTIDQRNVMPSGGIGTSPLTENVITGLVFTPYPSSDDIQAVGITIEVTDQSTGQKQALHTAGYSWNRQ